MFPRWLHFLAVFLMCTSAARAVSIVGKPKVEPAGTTATVRWTTDVECGTTVWYGLAPEKLDRKAMAGVGTAHSVTLAGLQPGTLYHFSVGTARNLLTSGKFTMPGVRETFKPPATPAVPRSGPEPAVASRLAPAVTSSLRPPPTSVSWANIASLPDHFARHGADFRAKNPDDYAAQAWLFLQRAKAEGLPAKQDPDGVLRIWDPRTGAFAAYEPDGTTKTYFKPNSPDYFQRQPGRAVRLKSDLNPR